MNRSLIAAIAALLLVGAGLWWWGTSTPQAAPPAAAAVVEDTTASEPVARPRTGPAPAARPAPAAAPVPTAPQPAPAAPAPSAQLPEPAMTSEEAYALGSLPRLKNAFETDPVDAQAAGVERDIRGLFGGEQMPLDTLLGVQCRERVCKLELRWTPDRPYTFMAAGQAVGKLVSRNSAVEALAGPDAKGERRLAVYVARREYRAHQLEEPAQE